MFNPFDKPLKDLDLEDLNGLIASNFFESQFIEYKSEMPKPEKIAKAIAGFANSHGGFLIVGADKDSGKKDLPTGFPGARDLPDDPRDHIRKTCRDHISPMPLIQVKYIPTDKDRGLLIVQVPESMDCPHINKDGRIYRRQSSGTDGESIAEDSRSAIDYLYAKGHASEAAANHYIESKQDPKRVDQLALKDNYFSIETIICPIPINELIPDLFADNEKYAQLLHASRYDFNVDIDCIYFEESDYYEEIDTKGCISIQHIESTMLPSELTGFRIPSKYASIPIVLPEWISRRLRKPLITMRKVLQELNAKSIDYFGKIRIAVILRKVKGKTLFYKDKTFYDDYDVKVCRHETLLIPSIDLYPEDLENEDDKKNKIMRNVTRGFNLPFYP